MGTTLTSAEAAMGAARTAQLRSRIVRGAALLAIGGVAYAAAVLWQRDTTRIRQSVESLEPWRQALQSALDSLGQLPLRLDPRDLAGKPLSAKGFTYLDIDRVQALRQFEGEALLGYSPTVGLALRKDGRAALLSDGRHARVTWMTGAEFADWYSRQSEWIEKRFSGGPASPP